MQGKYILDPKSFDGIFLADEMKFADEMNKMSTVILGDLWNI